MHCDIDTNPELKLNVTQPDVSRPSSVCPVADSTSSDAPPTHQADPSPEWRLQQAANILVNGAIRAAMKKRADNGSTTPDLVSSLAPSRL